MRVQLDPNRWLYLEIEQLQEEVERLKQAQRWIPVEERLPWGNGSVLVASDDGNNSVAFAQWHKDQTECVFWDESGESIENVTHWMPLPEPPKREVQG